MDSHGYPDDNEIDKIKNWPWEDLKSCFDFVQTLWRYPEHFKIYEKGDYIYYRLACLGWSGNEELIAAMEQNLMLMAMTWVLSKSGGLYVFRLKKSNEGSYREL